MPSCKHFGLVIYMMSNPNEGFMLEGWFLEINVLPLLALGPLDTVHKNKCSDIFNSYIKYRLLFCMFNFYLSWLLDWGPTRRRLYSILYVSELVRRRVGPSASWSVGKLVRRQVGPSASWSVGKLVRRQVGPSASWSVGKLVRRQVGPSASWP